VKVIRSVWSTDHLGYLKTVSLFAHLTATSKPTGYQKFLQEAQVWSQLNHPNITPFLGVCFDLGTPSAPCLVCPYYSNGNVAQYLEKRPDADKMKLVGIHLIHEIRQLVLKLLEGLSSGLGSGVLARPQYHSWGYQVGESSQSCSLPTSINSP